MIISLFSLFKKTPQEDAATSLYRAAMDQSRLPGFYADWGVPDTFEGRFEMVTLHVFLLMRMIKESEDIDPETNKIMGQKLFDAMFLNLDDTLREMGVGDLSVSKKIRKMAEAFYGRVGVYEAAFAKLEQGSSQAEDGLNMAVQKNVYGIKSAFDDRKDNDRTDKGALDIKHSGHLTDYAITCFQFLQKQPVGRVLKGIVYFPPFK